MASAHAAGHQREQLGIRHRRRGERNAGQIQPFVRFDETATDNLRYHEAALLIVAHARRGLDVPAELARIAHHWARLRDIEFEDAARISHANALRALPPTIRKRKIMVT